MGKGSVFTQLGHFILVIEQSGSSGGWADWSYCQVKTARVQEQVNRLFRTMPAHILLVLFCLTLLKD